MTNWSVSGQLSGGAWRLSEVGTGERALSSGSMMAARVLMGPSLWLSLHMRSSLQVLRRHNCILLPSEQNLDLGAHNKAGHENDGLLGGKSLGLAWTHHQTAQEKGGSVVSLSASSKSSTGTRSSGISFEASLELDGES